MIRITQGDIATLALTAEDADGIPINLTGATLTTYIGGVASGDVVTIANAQHTILNQTTYPGRYDVAITALVSASFGLGEGKEIITKVSLSAGASIVYFHGVNMLDVLSPAPLF
jgi:hypothetical protein